MKTRYWCELAWLGGPRATPGVVIEVDGDRIIGVDPGQAAPPPDATPLMGLTLPALANAHSHAFHRALRGRTHGGRGTFWTWRDLMYRVAGILDPDSYYRLARATFAEMALAGVGVVGEFHYVHHRPAGGPYDDPNAIGVSLAVAARDAGVRLTLLDALYIHGGFAPGSDSGYAPLTPEQARFSDGSVHAWAERVASLAAGVSGPRTKVAAAVHSVRAVDPPSIEAGARWARENRVPLHVHVSEQPAENEACLQVHGRTPTAVLAEAGALGPDTTLVHATHLSDLDTATIGEAGAHCCICPTTERDLADGIGASEALVRAGATLCVGSDSHAVIDIMEEARAVELGQRVLTHRRGIHPTDDPRLHRHRQRVQVTRVGRRRRDKAGMARRLHQCQAGLGPAGRDRRRQRFRRGDLRRIERRCTQRRRRGAARSWSMEPTSRSMLRTNSTPLSPRW